MRSIAIMNQKGGVGKTTTSVNLGAALADSGKSVEIIDLDPQAHASLHLGVEPQSEFPSIYDVLVENKKLKEVRRQVNDHLWLIPAHLDLAGTELALASAVGRDLILRNKIATDDMKFDYIIVDCPPSLGVLTFNALAAVNEVFIPLQPHYLALHGLSKLLQTINIVAGRLNGPLKVTGVLFCLFEGSTTLAREVSGDVETFFEQERAGESPWSQAQIFKTRIRRNIRLAEAPSFGRSIFQYDSHSNGAEDYHSLACEVLEQENKE